MPKFVSPLAPTPVNSEIHKDLESSQSSDLNRDGQAFFKQKDSYEPAHVGSNILADRPLQDEVVDGQSANEYISPMDLLVGQMLPNIVNGQPVDGGRLAHKVDQALSMAEKNGDPVLYKQGMDTLATFCGLSLGKGLDIKGRDDVQTLFDNRQAHRFGLDAADVSDALAPRPTDGRRARIVATLNPEADQNTLDKMVAAGMEVARFNPAHADITTLRSCIQRVRQAGENNGRDVAIQIDLAGPKIRLGNFKNPNHQKFNDIFLIQGETVTLTTADILGDPKLLPVDYPTLAKDVRPGESIFMNDGTVHLRATKVREEGPNATGIVEAEVLEGGKVWDRKGINLPDSTLSVETITEADLEVLDGLLESVDMVALSFVRSASDIEQLKKEMKARGRVVPVIAKIERQEPLAELEAITQAADAVMVARGDLGVEIGYDKVPQVEARINALGNRYGKPTMVATEVLLSMAKGETRPSRADVHALNDAICHQGADMIMLGKETSFPDNPERVVQAAAKIIRQAEHDLWQAKTSEPSGGSLLSVLVQQHKASKGD
jgi:pyruvate kinase